MPPAALSKIVFILDNASGGEFVQDGFYPGQIHSFTCRQVMPSARALSVARRRQVTDLSHFFILPTIGIKSTHGYNMGRCGTNVLDGIL